MIPQDKASVPLPSILLRKNFPFEPTAGQAKFFVKMDVFLEKKELPIQAFVLKGFAGTGKTSVLSSLVRVLPRFQKKSMLLAPTGRAAKIMANYSGKSAFTIHKIIYKPKGEAGDLGQGFELQKNYNQDTVFIVDESSMLADEVSFGRSLLADLIKFVFQVPSNSLLFVGDTAQLPPVGSLLSPALDPSYLQRYFRLKVDSLEMTEVMRQQLDSGILFNATALRNLLKQDQLHIHFVTKGFSDFFKMTGERLEDGLRYAYDKYGIENTTIITRSNKSAVQYNQYIRQVIHFYEDEISAGDLLMVVKNNYTYMADSELVNFIANGDFVEIIKIRSFEELYGLRFATLELRLIDYPDEPYFEAKVILDTLHSPLPSLSVEQYRSLYQQVSEDYLDVANVTERKELIKKDPYLSALQIKFAYALTCHKSQGGQWDAVFVDQGYLTDEKINEEFVRWLYTALTRAKKEVFLVNFHQKFYDISV
ncbi:ATP-dependent DNA helicase [Mongoliitalea daihaiensis]|uniref:ATP-dependent DNA helicase n=1 Tax=Mongoliitalea daihaiensis TaxID=2782006 RepID=UPI001F329103|nr:ATP-binding domain-containing protein [Mongoliitalea daihaiensis]UJP63587.1 AAA family ATPase [Mongoliitalea daihaiensis]